MRIRWIFLRIKYAETFLVGNVAYAATDVIVKKPGVTNVSNATANANVVISGNLVSHHSQYTGDVKITSAKATFSDSRIDGSVIMKSIKRPPVLELRCGTKITGDVTFVGLAGVVRKSADSVISGKVLNGKVEAVVDDEKC